MPSTTCHIESFGIETYQNLEDEWQKLLYDVPDAPPYLSFHWGHLFIANRRVHGTIHILTARQNDMLVAVLPLSVRNVAWLKIAEPIGTGQAARLGILVHPEHHAVIPALADYILCKKLFDIYYTKDLLSNDYVTGLLLKKLQEKKFCCRFIKRNSCYYIRLDGPFDAYLQNTKSKKRAKQLKYEEKRLNTLFDVSIEYYAGTEITEQVYERIVTIQNESWMKRRGAAVIGQPFQRTLLCKMAQTGFGRLWLMKIDNEDAAFVLALTHVQQFHYYRTAFKLKYESRLSIGKMLTMYVIRQACQMDFKHFDFGQGEGEYKRFWATGHNDVFRVAAGRGVSGRFFVEICSALWKLPKVKFLRILFRTARKLRNKLTGRANAFFHAN